MGYTSTLETCSVEVWKGVEWLKSSVDVDKTDSGGAVILCSGKIRSRVGRTIFGTSK